MSDTPETKEPELNRVLVIGAHPDDPEFGCAATVAKWAAAGKEIHYLLLTSGDKGSHNPAERPGQVAAKREEEQRGAAKALGVTSVKFLHYPDGMVENNMALRGHLCGLVRRFKPDIVLAIDPWRPYQLHPDHRAAGMAALDAVWAAREWYLFPEQLVGEDPWRVSEVYLYWTGDPNHWEDVSSSIETRIEALSHHDSQINGRVDKVRERILKGAAETGEAQGYAYAEAFHKIKL